LGRERLGVEVPSSEQLSVHAEELARVNGCLVRMARLEREVVMLSLLDEQPRERVGELLGISAGYVRVLLHRAREQHAQGTRAVMNESIAVVAGA